MNKYEDERVRLTNALKRHIPIETWYEWKEYLIVEGEDTPRLLTPRGDPMEYEFAIDFMFETIEQAYKFLEEWDIDREESKDWVLVKVTFEPLVGGYKMKKFYRNVIKIEILSDELYPDCVTLEQIHYDITEGHCSGQLFTEVFNEELTREQMTEALIAQGSDPEFLLWDGDVLELMET